MGGGGGTKTVFYFLYQCRYKASELANIGYVTPVINFPLIGNKTRQYIQNKYAVDKCGLKFGIN